MVNIWIEWGYIMELYNEISWDDEMYITNADI